MFSSVIFTFFSISELTVRVPYFLFFKIIVPFEAISLVILNVAIYSGITGLSGSVGFSGSTGLSGSSGSVGFSGISGSTGLSGSVGLSGSIGFSGISGISGLSGSDGSCGFVGTLGLLPLVSLGLVGFEEPGLFEIGFFSSLILSFSSSVESLSNSVSKSCFLLSSWLGFLLLVSDCEGVFSSNFLLLFITSNAPPLIIPIAIILAIIVFLIFI